jgi:hypothetical protein
MRHDFEMLRRRQYKNGIKILFYFKVGVTTFKLKMHLLILLCHHAIILNC